MSQRRNYDLPENTKTQLAEIEDMLRDTVNEPPMEQQGTGPVSS